MSAHHNTLADRLRRVIDRAGGMKTFADAVGVTTQAVYGWLEGTVPYRKTLSKLALRFNLNEQWLLTGEGPEEWSGGARLHDPMPHENPPPTALDDQELGESLAELVAGFHSLPSQYRRLAYQGIVEHWREFSRRAEMHTAVAGPITYPRGKRKS